MWSVSGEVLAPDLAKRFKLACPGRKLINLYGSSEVAADVLVHEVEDADIDGPCQSASLLRTHRSTFSTVRASPPLWVCPA